MKIAENVEIDKKKREKKTHLPLQTLYSLPTSFSSQYHFSPSDHFVGPPSFSFFSLYLFVYAAKAPLNLTHRTNGLLYASAYMRTIPFYRDPPYLLRRYLL